MRGVSYVRGDILDYEDLRAAMEGCYAVFHLAAVLGVARCQGDERLVRAVNGLGTANVAAAVESVESVLSVTAVSSSEVYGESQEELLTEDSPLRPLSLYGTLKVSLEERFSSLAMPTRQVTILRPFNVYGPGQRDSFVVSRFCQSIVRGDPVPVLGDGTQTRTFTYVDDFVNGTLAAFSHGLSRQGGLATFNIAGDHTVSVLRLAELLAELSGHPLRLARGLDRPEDLGRRSTEEIHDRRPSIDLARRVLGYAPETSLVKGLATTLAWHRAAGPVGPRLAPGLRPPSAADALN